MSVKLNEGQYFGREIRSLEQDFFKLTLVKYEPFITIEKHCHENNYLSLMADGRYNEKNEFENNMLETGSIIFRPSNYDHSHSLKKNGGTCFNIEFKKTWKQQVDFDFKLPNKCSIYKTGCFPAIYKLLYHFINNCREDFLSELILEWLIEINNGVSIKSSLPWFGKVKEILENELATRHTIRSVAERVFIHPVYLAGAFKKMAGYTIGEYQMKVKLEKAVSLLFNTELPVTDIAFATGFYDPAHLINSFKLVYQTSPNKLRAIKKKLT